jgi:hypothetical protein
LFTFPRSYQPIYDKPVLAQADANANVVLYTLDNKDDITIDTWCTASGFTEQQEINEEENDDHILNRATQEQIAFENYQAKAHNMCLSLDWNNRVQNHDPEIVVSQSNGHISIIKLTNSNLQVRKTVILITLRFMKLGKHMTLKLGSQLTTTMIQM